MGLLSDISKFELSCKRQKKRQAPIGACHLNEKPFTNLYFAGGVLPLPDYYQKEAGYSDEIQNFPAAPKLEPPIITDMGLKPKVWPKSAPSTDFELGAPVTSTPPSP